MRAIENHKNRHSYACINGLVLKLVAIGTMLIDHIGAVLFPNLPVLRGIGRISFPIFVFLIVEGFRHTKNIRKYELRMLVFAFVSEIPFNLAFRNTLIEWEYQNVFFTLFLGLVALDVMRTVRSRLGRVRGEILGLALLIGFMLAAWLLKTDYDAGGVLLVYLFYRYRGKPVVQSVCLFAISFIYYGWLECYSVIAMVPIALYNGQRGFAPDGVYGGAQRDVGATVVKYLFYVFYPAHLVILYLIAEGFFCTFGNI